MDTIKPAAIPSSAPAPKLLSAVQTLENDNNGGIENRKRAADKELLEEKPEMKRRNRRLFGNLLLGTLRKFKKEEDVILASEAAQRRAAAEQSLLRKSQAAKLEAMESKTNDLFEHKKKLILEREILDLEQQYQRRIGRKEREESMYLRTNTQPAVLWAPKVLCDSVTKAFADQKERLEAWRNEQRSIMEAEIERRRAKDEGDLKTKPAEPGGTHSMLT